MPWISLDDLLDVILHALTDPELSGAVNAVAPRVVRNREFTGTLGRILRRPTALRVPGTVLRAAGGQMAEEMLLGSLRVEPEALRRAGHRFRHPELEGALRHLLGRTASRRIGRIS
jgi:NAD dependent epimerase/dehydratase family enzyme